MFANDLTTLKGMSVIKSFLYLTEHLFLKATIGWGAKEIFINVLEMALTKRIKRQPNMDNFIFIEPNL